MLLLNTRANEKLYVLENMIWLLFLFLTTGNGQFTQESTESTPNPRLPWNRYDDWDQNTGFGLRNPSGQNENVIIKES